MVDILLMRRYLMLISNNSKRRNMVYFQVACFRRSLWSGQVVTRPRLPLLYCHLNRQTDSRAPEIGFLILSSSSMTPMLY